MTDSRNLAKYSFLSSNFSLLLRLFLFFILIEILSSQVSYQLTKQTSVGLTIHNGYSIINIKRSTPEYLLLSFSSLEAVLIEQKKDHLEIKRCIYQQEFFTNCQISFDFLIIEQKIEENRNWNIILRSNKYTIGDGLCVIYEGRTLERNSSLVLEDKFEYLVPIKLSKPLQKFNGLIESIEEKSESFDKLIKAVTLIAAVVSVLFLLRT